MKLSRVILYDDPHVPEIDARRLAAFAEKTFHVSVEVRGPLLAGVPERDLLPFVVRDTRTPPGAGRPTSAGDCRDPERENRDGAASRRLYDGFALQDFASGLVPASELSLDALSVLLTDMLTCTYDYEDYRYHARAVVCSNPAVISSAGIIAAPARPREYYLDVMRGAGRDELEERYAGRYLEYGDARMQGIAEGYLMQAIFFHATGEPFCRDFDCRLFNSHWQAELLHSQLESGRLCSRHDAVLRNIFG